MNVKDLKPLPDQAYLAKILRFEPETGKLFWRQRTPDMVGAGNQSRTANCSAWNKNFFGKEAICSVSKAGYLRGAINNSSVFAHRVIWKLHHGSDPMIVDHINGDRTDNRIANLRSVTAVENARNVINSRKSATGHMGVAHYKDGRRFIAYIKFDGRKRHIGIFDTLEDAVAARADAQRAAGFHDGHGRPDHRGEAA